MSNAGSTRDAPGGEERAARAAWSALAEPGDDAANAVVAALGPIAALEWVRAAARSLEGAVAQLVGKVTRDQALKLVAAHERWARRLEWANAPWAERATRIGARIVIPQDPEWPESLASLGAAAPFALWVRGGGDLRALWDRSIAIVGARASTSYGERIAGEFACGVAERGWSVLSGGAYGIDGVAHRAALASERPTVAIMAGGVDRLYPAGHEPMLRSVLEAGCVVSEVPPGFAPHRSRFLQRNRLIATAAATVVVEAAARSGALNTARQAAILLRPVGAVPGPVTSASSAGCHGLVREGAATLVTSVGDVLDLVQPLTEQVLVEAALQAEESRGAGARGHEFSSPAHRAVFDATSSRPRATEDVARGSGLALGETQGALIELEALGHVVRERGGWRKAPARLSAQKRT
jgi:DNA processing protein